MTSFEMSCDTISVHLSMGGPCWAWWSSSTPLEASLCFCPNNAFIESLHCQDSLHQRCSFRPILLYHVLHEDYHHNMHPMFDHSSPLNLREASSHCPGTWRSTETSFLRVSRPRTVLPTPSMSWSPTVSKYHRSCCCEWLEHFLRSRWHSWLGGAPSTGAHLLFYEQRLCQASPSHLPSSP
jgi:hypothetical protein